MKTKPADSATSTPRTLSIARDWLQQHHIVGAIVALSGFAVWLIYVRLSGEPDNAMLWALTLEGAAVLCGVTATRALLSWRPISALERKKEEAGSEFAAALKLWSRKDVLHLANQPQAPDYLRRDLKSFRPSTFRAERTQLSDWHLISRTLFHAGSLCRKLHNQKIEDETRKLYKQCRRIIFLEYLDKLFRAAFFLLALWLSQCAGVLLLRVSGGIATPDHWNLAFGLIVLGAGHAVAVLYALQWCLRWFVERTRSEFDDILVGVLSGPLASVLFAGFAVAAIEKVSQVEDFLKGRNQVIFLVVLATWISVYFFHYVLIYSLKRWAARTAQKYDDMFVQLFHVFGSLSIVAVGGAVILVQFRGVLADSVNVLLPYSIVVSVAGAILGLASREAIENFFGGVLLQIDKPFENGDRLMLATGEICEVREVGMRTTTLYNVLENNNIYFPNSVLANSVITNLSRPDTEWRIQFRFNVPIYLYDSRGDRCSENDGSGDWSLLTRIENNLMDLAYLTEEIDRCRVRKLRIPPYERLRDRICVEDELTVLRAILPEIAETDVWRNGKRHPALTMIESALTAITALKDEYNELVSEEKRNRIRRLELMRELALQFGRVESFVLGLATIFKDSRPEFDRLIGELHKEPRLSSEFVLTEDGYSFIQLVFSVFSVHTERRSDVAHYLLKAMRVRFAEEQLPLEALTPRRIPDGGTGYLQA